MQESRAVRYLFLAGCVLLVILLLLHPSAPEFFPSSERTPCVSLLYASSGSLPQLLNTGQIDAFLIWEPVVANAELSGIGKRIAVPSDLPPPGKWDDAAINVLVLRDDIPQTYLTSQRFSPPSPRPVSAVLMRIPLLQRILPRTGSLAKTRS